MGGTQFEQLVSGRRVAGTIRSLVSARSLQLEYAKVFMRNSLFLFSCMVVRQ